ncbi:hypothetical protein IWQ60_012155, partial [Tieghemiomyces parasiticus]
MAPAPDAITAGNSTPVTAEELEGWREDRCFMRAWHLSHKLPQESKKRKHSALP